MSVENEAPDRKARNQGRPTELAQGNACANGESAIMNSGNVIVKTVRHLLSVCILFLCAASVALAQAGRGTVSGTVTDSGGAMIPGAQVVLLNRATGSTQHTVTSAAGLYTFVSLNPGVYQVTASQTGFASVAQDKIGVSVDQVTQVTSPCA